MGVEPFLLASSLLGVLAQRLVRKLCPVCKEERIEGGVRTGIRSAASIAGNPATRAVAASTNCCSSTTGSRPLIHRNAADAEILAAGRAQGMRSMREDGEPLARRRASPRSRKCCA